MTSPHKSALFLPRGPFAFDQAASHCYTMEAVPYDTVTLKPERKAQLEEFARKHGKDPAEALDEALAAYFDSEQRDFEEAVAGNPARPRRCARGTPSSSSGFLDELRVKHDFRVETTPSAEREAQAILEWLLDRQAGETGLRWFLNLEQAIQSLSHSPE